MRLVYFLCVVINISSVANTAHAGSQFTSNLKIVQISVARGNGTTNRINNVPKILVQTSPRHAVAGLLCTSDQWLEMDIDESGSQATDASAMMSMLIAAQQSGTKVHVRADDNDRAAEFCELGRLILIAD